MANSRSARKRIRANERKRIRNRAVRSAVRTKVTKARRALLAGAAVIDMEQELKNAVKALDRAGEKGILHRNNVARRKSRLTSMAARLIRMAQSSAEGQAEARAAAGGGEKGRSTKGAKPSTTTRARAKTAAKSGTKAPVTKTAKMAAAKSAAARAKGGSDAPKAAPSPAGAKGKKEAPSS